MMIFLTLKCYNPENRYEKKLKDSKAFSHNELRKKDKTNLDIFSLKYSSLEDSDNLDEPPLLVERF